MEPVGGAPFPRSVNVKYRIRPLSVIIRSQSSLHPDEVLAPSSALKKLSRYAKSPAAKLTCARCNLVYCISTSATAHEGAFEKSIHLSKNTRIDLCRSRMATKFKTADVHSTTRRLAWSSDVDAYSRAHFARDNFLVPWLLGIKGMLHATISSDSALVE
jgi:hypothetical protein